MPEGQSAQSLAAQATALQYFEAAHRKIEEEQAKILALPPEQRNQLFRRSRRLEAIQLEIEDELRDLRFKMKGWLQAKLPIIYQDGTEQAFFNPTIRGARTRVGDLEAGDQAWTQVHRNAMNEIARDFFEDVLDVTRFVENDTKRWIRETGKATVAETVIIGDAPGKSVKELIEAWKKGSDGVKPISAIRYKNGALHTLEDYGTMLVRTKTAVARNLGTINFAVEQGIEVFEVFDGTDCSWPSGHGAGGANGRIVSAKDAAAYPTAHPNCVRNFGARPDLTLADADTFDPSTTEAQRIDQADFEQSLIDPVTGKKRVPRKTRAELKAEGRKARTPRKPPPEPVIRRNISLSIDENGQIVADGALNLEFRDHEGIPLTGNRIGDTDPFVAEIEEIPTAILEQLTSRGVTYKINVDDLNGVAALNEELRGVRPRGYGPGAVWDDVAGAYVTRHSEVLVASEFASSRRLSVLHHETGHAVDFKFRQTVRDEIDPLGDISRFRGNMPSSLREFKIRPEHHSRLAELLEEQGVGNFQDTSAFNETEKNERNLRARFLLLDELGQELVDVSTRVKGSDTPEFRRIYDSALETAPALRNYFKQEGNAGREEFFAESFAYYIRARPNATGQRSIPSDLLGRVPKDEEDTTDPKIGGDLIKFFDGILPPE